MNDLKLVLAQRKKVYKEINLDRRIAKRVINNFKRGKALQADHIQPHHINQFLVELPDSTHALHRVKESLEEIQYNLEWLFVVGDYGCGKSQLKNRIQIETERRSSGMVITSANLQADSLKAYTERFITNLKKTITTYHSELFIHFQSLFEEFSQAEIKDDDRRRIVVQLLKIGVQYNLQFLLQFDEMDQLSEEQNFLPWASLISSINDQINEGVLGIIFIADREISRLWNKDKRLVRLEAFLSTRLDPGSRFREKYLEGFANIASLYEIANSMEFHPYSLNLVDQYLRLQKDRLSTLNYNKPLSESVIRRVSYTTDLF